MANGKVVYYKKIYKIVIEGKTDTRHPEDKPIQLTIAEEMLHAAVGVLNEQYKSHNVTIKEIKR